MGRGDGRLLATAGGVRVLSPSPRALYTGVAASGAEFDSGWHYSYPLEDGKQAMRYLLGHRRPARHNALVRLRDTGAETIPGYEDK